MYISASYLTHKVQICFNHSIFWFDTQSNRYRWMLGSGNKKNLDLPLLFRLHLYKRVCLSVHQSVYPSVRYASSDIMQMMHRVARLGLLQKVNSRCYHHSLTSSPPELPWMRLEKWLQCLVTQTSSAIRLFTLLLHHHVLPLLFTSLWLFLSLSLHHNHRCSSSSSVYLFIVIGIPLHHHHRSHR